MTGSDNTVRDSVLSGPASGMDETPETETKEEPQWETVDSSRYKRHKYDPSTLTLHIEWKNGTTGRYLNVPVTVFEDFRTSDSLGKALQSKIIAPNYEYKGDNKQEQVSS